MQEPRLIAAKPRSLRRRLIWGVVIVAIAGAVAWVLIHNKQQQQAGQGAKGGPAAAGANRGGRFAQTGPIPVVAAAVSADDLDISLDELGTVTPLATVTVMSQIDGFLTEIAFKEGQTVKKGDFLAQIDPRPYQAQLNQDLGQLQHDEALLKDAQLDLARYRTLLAQDSIASQQVDTQEALVQQDIGTVATDKGKIETDRLNLTYCHIVAPVTGRVGIRQVDVGNYVQTSSTTGIVVLTQMQPMSVIFTLPEDQLPAVLKAVNKGDHLRVHAFDRAKTTKLATGALDSIDSQIDPTTGTVKLRAMFDNDPAILFPQQFVNVELRTETLKAAKNVPSAGVQNGAPGTYVYLIKDDNTVTVRPVKTGPQSGDRVTILSGLEVGDRIVVDGADKLREGTAISLPASGGNAPSQATKAGSADGAAPGQDREHHRRDKDNAAPANKASQ